MSTFLQGFERDPSPAPSPVADGPPPWPESTMITYDSYQNYWTLQDAAPDVWGCTGLMSVAPVTTDCYGTSPPGTLFLLPGTYENPAPPYPDAEGVTFNCAPQAPIVAATAGPLHVQMCDLLGQPPKYYIGFGVLFPLSAGGMGYNSTTCNEYWFNGQRQLPPDWQAFVHQALQSNLDDLAQRRVAQRS